MPLLPRPGMFCISSPVSVPDVNKAIWTVDDTARELKPFIEQF